MRKAQILLVEDDEDVLFLNKKHLMLQGYEVMTAATLKEARTLIWEHPPDLIVLDVLMPDGSGYDFCTEIREFSSVPVLYLTCMDKDENIVCGLTRGADDYITKPYSLEVLFARIMAQLRRYGFVNAGRIEMPPLTLDLLSGRVTLFDEEISLSQKELHLLACLASNMGRMFTAAELYETIWCAKANGANLSTVYVHISNLKKKLRLNDNSPFELRSAKTGAYALFKVRYVEEW